MKMLSEEQLMLFALKDHVRVNTTLKTVEIYDEYGVKLVLRDLTDAEYEAFAKTFKKY